MQNHPSSLKPTNVPRTGEDTRPLGTIIAELWENTERLARQEIALGLAQVDQRVDHIKGDLARVTLGGAVLYAGVLSLVAAVVLLLAKAIDPWLSALIVGAVVGGTGYALLQRGQKRLGHEATEVGHDFKRAGQEVKESASAYTGNRSMREALK
jgi:uncharacterized MnhB-related membrane protein